MGPCPTAPNQHWICIDMKAIHRAKSLISRLAKHYGYRLERIVDYSNYQLDIFPVLIAQLNPTDPDFFFVQVGANDGRSGDPIHFLVKRYHWRGLLLEPQPNAFDELRENYREEQQLTLENIALSYENGQQKFYTVTGSSYLGSFDRDALVKRVRDSKKIIEVCVQAVTYPTLVARHHFHRVDLLLVDTEGFDYQVIKMTVGAGLPYPRLIRYEHLHLSTADREACAEYLATNGYRLLRDGRDTIAFRDGAASLT